MFLLEERDLLSQQLASESKEASATPQRPPARLLSPIPFMTPVTPSTLGAAPVMHSGASAAQTASLAQLWSPAHSLFRV